jgi:signal transduction histidine kinase
VIVPPVAPTDDAARLLRQRETLREVIESISSELELRPLLQRIVGHACELMEADDGSIGLYDEAANVMEIAAAHGLPAGELGRRQGPGQGLAGLVMARPQPVVLETYGSVPNPVWPELGHHAVVAVPILCRERLLGFFGIGAEPPRRFDQADLETLALFARHAAIAIENARRYQWEQRRTERLALIARIGHIITADLALDDLLERAAEAIHELLGYPNVDIPLVHPRDPDTLVVRARGGAYKRHIEGEDRLPITQGIMGAAVRERRVQLVNDVSADPRYVQPTGAVQVRAELAVPIVLGEHVLGVLNVESDQAFDQEDATSLQIIADHLAVAIRNARLFESASTLAVLEERERLSRDLHDSVTQMLFSVTLVAQSLIPAWRQDRTEGEARAQRLLQLSRLALAEMRALIADLRLDVSPHDSFQGVTPVGLSRVRREGLPAALRGYAEEISDGGLEVLLELEGYRPQPFEREEALFRIGQEALNNVVKHAQARRVVIALGQDRDGIHLRVQDDGRGFDPGALANAGSGEAGGLGLVGMHERARALRGELRFESEPGQGAAVTVTVPGEAGA